MEAERLLDAKATDADRSAIAEGLKKANVALLSMHTEEARRYIEGRQGSQAVEHLESALSFVGTAEERTEVMALLRQAQDAVAGQAATTEVEEVSLAPEPEDAVMSDEETFLALVNMLRPERADAYLAFSEEFRLAYVAMNEGRWDDAEALLVPVCEASPDSVYLKHELGRLRLCQERYEASEAILREAAEMAPDYLELRHDQVRALWGLERWDEAERIVELAFEIDDESLDNFLLAGQTCLRSGEYANGVELMEAGLELHPQSLQLHRLLGRLEMAQDNAPMAIQAFESVLRLYWRYDYESGRLNFDQESAFLVANLYLSTQVNLPRAEELFRALLSVGGEGRLAFLVGLGQALQLQSENVEARKVFMEASRLAPSGSPESEKIADLIVKVS